MTETEQTADSESSPGTNRVLVVDDHQVVRGITAELLRETGLTVDEAASGRSALDLIRAAPEAYRCVLMDLSMPGLAGSELVAALRAVCPGVRIVIMSGFGAEASALMVSDPDLAGFLSKPYEPDELVAIVGRALEAS